VAAFEAGFMIRHPFKRHHINKINSLIASLALVQGSRECHCSFFLLLFPCILQNDPGTREIICVQVVWESKRCPNNEKHPGVVLRSLLRHMEIKQRSLSLVKTKLIYTKFVTNSWLLLQWRKLLWIDLCKADTWLEIPNIYEIKMLII